MSEYERIFNNINKQITRLENQNNFEKNSLNRISLKDLESLPINKARVLRPETVARYGKDLVLQKNQDIWYKQDLEYRYRHSRGERGQMYAQAQIDYFIGQFRDTWLKKYVSDIVNAYSQEHSLRDVYNKINIAFNEGIVNTDVINYRSKHGGEPQSQYIQKFMTDFALLFNAPPETYDEDKREYEDNYNEE